MQIYDVMHACNVSYADASKALQSTSFNLVKIMICHYDPLLFIISCQHVSVKMILIKHDSSAFNYVEYFCL